MCKKILAINLTFSLIISVSIIGVSLFFLSSSLWAAPPPVPARIGGTLTIITIRQVTYTSGVSSVPSTAYTFEVTRPDGTSFEPDAVSAGITPYDTYILDIPIYEKDEQPNGAKPGEVAVIHVYENEVEQTVVSPPGGKLIIGNSGSRTPIDLTIQKNDGTLVYPDNTRIYTQEDLNMAAEEERQKWDANNDGKIGLEEAIRALQIISGIK